MKGRKSKLSILLICGVMALGTIAVTYAAFTSKDQVTNVFKLGDVDIEVEEEFEEPQEWNGESYKKKVAVKNVGESDALIRVALSPRWVDEDGNPWAGDTSIVSYKFISNSDWIDGKDGYYYYNKRVAKGNATSNLIDTVKADIPEDLKEMYKNKVLIVDVIAEGVQCSKDAHRATWRTTSDDIKTMLNALCK